MPEYGSLSVLLIEDNPGDARLIREALAECPAERFQLVHVERLSSGVACLSDGDFDLVLLDLSLPDGDRLETLVKLRAHEPNLPVVVLTGLSDEAMALQAVQAGAQDYLVKGQFDGHLLIRAMRYAIERHRLQETIRDLSLTDELTRLRNRRGFLTLALQHLKLARRNRRQVTLVFADLDGLKQINDRFGHAEGDRALMDTARILKETSRASDITARLGGDEFVLMTSESSDDEPCPLVTRLHEALKRHNADSLRGYELSFSMGTVQFDPAGAPSLEEVLAHADELLYRNKRKKGVG